MTLHAAAQFPNGKSVASSGSMLAAFKDGRIRGVANLFDGPAEPMQFILAIGADSTPEKSIDLKVFDAASGRVYEIQSTVDFEADTTLGSITAPLILVAAGSAAADEANQPARDAVPALDLAFKLASAIPVYPHLHDRSQSQYKTLKQYLDMGRVESASQYAYDIQNWRRGVLLTEIAAHYARHTADVGQVRHFLKLAAESRDGIDGPSVGWQKDRITAHIALALAKAGFMDEADAAVEGIQDPVLAQVAVEKLCKIDSDEEYRQNMEQIEAMAETVHFELKQAAADALIRILSDRADKLSAEERDRIVKRIQEIVPKLPAALQTGVQCSFARAAARIGENDLAKQFLDEAVGIVEGRQYSASTDIANLAEIAAVSHETGRQAPAQSLLQTAAKILDSGKMPLREKVDAAIALAEGFAVTGNLTAAWVRYDEALALARSQVNGRPRFAMLVDLCVSIVNAQLTLPDKYNEALNEQLDRQGDPW